MPTTLNNNTIINNELAQTAYLERTQDVIDVFNAASGGAITIVNENVQGDFSKDAFYEISGAIAHRNVNSSATVTTTAIAMDEMVGVKVPFKFGPYSATEESFKRRQRSVEEFSMLIGQQYADAELEGYIAYGMAALVAAISSNSAMVDSEAAASTGPKTVTKAFRKFGDRFSRIATLCMDSASYLDYTDHRVDAALFNEADTIIYGGQPGTMGKPVLVSDQFQASKMLALQPGALNIKISQVPTFRGYELNDQENIAMAWRAEGTFNINVLGYSYATTAGANPNLATLGTAANWSKHATSNKATAGALINLTA